MKAGSLVKFVGEQRYAVLNEIHEGYAYLDGQSTPVPIESIEQNKLCEHHNNYRTKEQVEMSTGIKKDAGKASIILIPSNYITGTASVFDFGATKYGKDNFRYGLHHSRCINAAMRHLLAIADGEELDPESGLPHVYHASCSLAMYDYMRLHFPELNDIFELAAGGFNGKK